MYNRSWAPRCVTTHVADRHPARSRSRRYQTSFAINAVAVLLAASAHASIRDMPPGEGLVPWSDDWRSRVHGYSPRDPQLARAMVDWLGEYLDAVAAYGELPLGIVGSVCRNAVTVYARSVTVDRALPGEVWTSANIRTIARGLDAEQSRVEQFITQMLRIARNHGLEPAPAAYTTKRDKAGPYTPAEIDGFLRLIEAQPCERTRWELDVMFSVAAGAGAAAKDVRFLRFNEVHVNDAGVDVVLRGKAHVRTVPVAEPWATRLAALVAQRPVVDTPWLIAGGRDANLIHRLLERADWAGAARPVLSRLRTTWTVERLMAGCRIDMLRRMLGEQRYTSIGHAATFLPDTNATDTRFRVEVER